MISAATQSEGDVMAERGIVILGSGSLARSICYSLAAVCAEECVVTVVSTTPSSSAEVCYVADVRAASSGTPVRFRALSVGRYAAESISSILRQVRPRIVLNCASYQSPWEKTRAPSAWTALMNRAGFGLTLPLQTSHQSGEGWSSSRFRLSAQATRRLPTPGIHRSVGRLRPRARRTTCQGVLQ